MRKIVPYAVFLLCVNCQEEKVHKNTVVPFDEIIKFVDSFSSKDLSKSFKFDGTGGPGLHRFSSRLPTRVLAEGVVTVTYLKAIGEMDSPVAYFYYMPVRNEGYIIVNKDFSGGNIETLPQLKDVIGEKIRDRIYRAKRGGG